MSRRLVRRDASSNASLSLVIPVGLFGGGMLALAATTGKVRYVAEHLPITPTPNGFALLCLAVLSGGCWWRMHRVETPAHEFDELAPLRQRRAREHGPVAKPMRDVVWPADLGEVGPGPDGAWCQGRPRRIDRNAPEHRVYLTPVRRPGQRVRS